MKSGIYRLHYRGLSLRECWRFSREPFKFAIAVILKVIDFKGPQQWLPTDEAEVECAETELSENARQHLLPVVAEARALGYRRGRFGTFAHNLDPHTKEGFSYRALHDDGTRLLFIGLVQSDASGKLVSKVAPAGMIAFSDGTNTAFVNHNNYLDGSTTSRTVMVSGQRVSEIDRAMVEFAKRQPVAPRHFSSYDDMKIYSDQVERAHWETRIARGLFRPVLPE
jgi:hypothetical protein